MTGCRQDQSESWSALFPRAALIGGRFYDNRRIAKSPAPPSTVVLVGIELPRGETEASLFAADEDAPSVHRRQLQQYSVPAGREFKRAMVGMERSRRGVWGRLSRLGRGAVRLCVAVGLPEAVRSRCVMPSPTAPARRTQRAGTHAKGGCGPSSLLLVLALTNGGGSRLQHPTPTPIGQIDLISNLRSFLFDSMATSGAFSTRP